MDLAKIDKPEWLTDEEWAELKSELRKGRFLAQILPDQVALVRAGANRRGFYSAKSEDEMTKEEKAAGAALKMLMAYQQKMADLVDKVKGMDAEDELDEATVKTIAALGAEMAKMGGTDTGMDEKAKAEAEAKADAERKAQAEADEKARTEAAEEAKKAAAAIADEAVKKAVESVNARLEPLEKRVSEMSGKLEVVEKADKERTDELMLLADTIETVINPTAPGARA